MKFSHRSSRFLVAVLLTGTLLRAFVPAGYMPATAGQGLLFQLCHDGMPPAIMAALGGHAHGHSGHGHHDANAATGPESTCNIGHILSLAVIDAVESVDTAAIAPVSFAVGEAPPVRIAARTHAFSARAPPRS